MKKKTLIRAALALVVVLAAVLVASAFMLGDIIKKGVETVGPKAAGVENKLQGAQVWLLAGRAQLNGFVLGNPAGCKTPSAITVDEVSVRIQPGSVMSEKLIVNRIEVKSPVVTLEGGLSDNNLKTIEKNLNDYVAGPSGGAKSNAPAGGGSKSGRKLQVNDLLITGAKLQVNSMLTVGQTVTLPLPDIHLTDMGTGPEGITGAEVAERAMNALLASVTDVVTKNVSTLGKDILGGAKSVIKGAGDLLKSITH